MRELHIQEVVESNFLVLIQQDHLKTFKLPGTEIIYWKAIINSLMSLFQDKKEA